VAIFENRTAGMVKANLGGRNAARRRRVAELIRAACLSLWKTRLRRRLTLCCALSLFSRLLVLARAAFENLRNAAYMRQRRRRPFILP